MSEKLYGRLTIDSGYPTYAGPYEITPKANEEQILKTQNHLMKDNVTVLEIPYYEVNNEANGTTAFIAKEV